MLISEFLKACIKRYNETHDRLFSASEFARVTGMSRKNIRYLLDGNGCNLATLETVCKYFDTSHTVNEPKSAKDKTLNAYSTNELMRELKGRCYKRDTCDNCPIFSDKCMFLEV